MTVEELIELLDQFNPEAEVRIASGQGWPMEYDLADVAPNSDELTDVLTDDEAARRRLNPVVYLAEGRQIGYLPHDAAVAVGWAEPSEYAERD